MVVRILFFIKWWIVIYVIPLVRECCNWRHSLALNGYNLLLFVFLSLHGISEVFISRSCWWSPLLLIVFIIHSELSLIVMAVCWGHDDRSQIAVFFEHIVLIYNDMLVHFAVIHWRLLILLNELFEISLHRFFNFIWCVECS